jgi:hypothetical protein
MWALLDRLGRPPLMHVLALQVGQLDGLALREDPGRGSVRASELRQAALASEACWLALREAVGRRRWRRVRASLRQQRRLLSSCEVNQVETNWLVALASVARSSRQARAVQRLGDQVTARDPKPLRAGPAARVTALMHKRACHAPRLRSIEPQDEALVQQGIVRIYRKTRRHLAHAPRSTRARRWLGHQRRVLELLGIRRVGVPTGLLERLAAGADRLEALLAEDAWLRDLAHGRGRARSSRQGLTRRDVDRLAKLARRRRCVLQRVIESERRQVFGSSPAVFAAALPWECFRAGARSTGASRVRPAGAGG